MKGAGPLETGEGTKTLPELLDGRSQLLGYHFMFGPSYTAGCPTCSAAADTFDGGVVHLNNRDVTFLCASRAPPREGPGVRAANGLDVPLGFYARE